MGYRGKVEEQERARVMRADGMTLLDIASRLGVSKSSVSLWVRDVEFTPSRGDMARSEGRIQRTKRSCNRSRR